MKPIKAIPIAARPRERLIALGPKKLTNAELIAIILNTGTKNQDVLEISQKVFPIYAKKPIYLIQDILQIQKELDIPKSHACKVIACIELAYRLGQRSKTYIFSPEDVYTRYRYLKRYTKEHVIGMYMNARSELIHEEIISIGTTDASLISTKDVFEPAIIHHATGILICHNHPSGSPEPSREDLDITQKLKEAGVLLHIQFLGHVVIGKRGYKCVPLV